MLSENLNYWKKLSSREHVPIRKDGQLSFTTTSQYNFSLLAEINELRAALGEACDVIKELEKLTTRGPSKGRPIFGDATEEVWNK